jgi:hypothetical protein
VSDDEDLIVIGLVGGIGLLALGAYLLMLGAETPPGGGGGGGGGGGAGKGSLAYLTYNDGLTGYLVANKAKLKAGDWFHLSSGNWGGGFSVSNLNKWADEIAAVCPGAVFVAHTGGQPNVDAILKAGLSSKFTHFALDYEPNEPGFNSNESATIAILKKFTDDCHAHNLKAVGYMTGQGIKRFGPWDYGQIMKQSGLDHMTVQTQGREGVAGGNGPWCMDHLAAQFNAAGVSPTDLTCQATVGNTTAATVTTQEVVSTYNEALKVGMVQFFLEWAGPTESNMTTVLLAIGR